MEARDPTKENHQARSDFVRELVQRSGEHDVAPAAFSTEPPRTIVQFWNDLNQLPGDVRACIESWRTLEEQGFNRASAWRICVARSKSNGQER